MDSLPEDAFYKLQQREDLELLDYDQLLELTGLSRKTVERWRREWGFPYIQQDEGCQIYFPVGPVKKWIQDRVQPTDETTRGELADDIRNQEILE